MKYKKIGYLIAGLSVAFSIGRFTAPAKVQTKEVERVVYRENQSTNRNQNLVEIKKETRLPDGTLITETRKENQTSTQTQTEKNSESKKSSSKTIEVRTAYRVGAIWEPVIKGFQEASYSVTLEKRLFSELYVGVSVSSQKTIGFSVSLGF